MIGAVAAIAARVGVRSACTRTAKHRRPTRTCTDENKHTARMRSAESFRSTRTRAAKGRRAAPTLAEGDTHAARTRTAENQTGCPPVVLVVRPSGSPQSETVLGIRRCMLLLQRGIPHSVQVRELREGLCD